MDVPAGIRSGQTLRLTGRGDAGPRGGSPGDLYVHIRVRDHEVFEREEDDLVAYLPLSVAQAALGTHIVLQAFDGELDLVMEAGEMLVFVQVVLVVNVDGARHRLRRDDHLMA